MIFRFLVAAIFVVLAQFLLYRVYSVRRLRYSCSVSQLKVSQGDSVDYCEIIENGGFLPLLWLRIEARLPESLLFLRNDSTRVSAGIFHRSVLSALPGRRIRRVYRVTCSRRGYYRLGASSVEAGDLFGLTTNGKTFESDTGLHVYPLPVPYQNLRLPAHAWQGDMVVRRFILPDPFMPAGVRDYFPGDPMSSINWKASAKTGKLAVHRFEHTADSKLIVFFNIDQWDTSGVRPCEAFEYDISLLAAITGLVLSNGQSAGLRTNVVGLRDAAEVSVPPGAGRAQKERLLTAMSELQLKTSRSFFMLLREASETVRDADILLMIRFLTKEIAAEAENLRQAGNRVEVLTVPYTDTP
jgi:uncharacterized protein (DUF58 family)